MTKQEALQELMDLSIDYGTRTADEIERLDEAVDMAIKALRADAVDRQTCEDAVSRQQAIDALMVRDKELRNINWYDKPYAEGECRGIDEALTIVSNLPSVQPEPKPDENGSEPFGNAEMLGDRTTDDCISRQAVIDALEKVAELYPWRVPGDRDSYSQYNEAWQDALNRADSEIEALPSAQPQQIVRCKDCKHWLHERQCIELSEFGTIETLPNEFCSRAERRTDD